MNEGVTIAMLYELLKEFKVDVNRRFAEQDKRFDLQDRRFDHLEADIAELKTLMLRDQEKLQQVYDSRNAVQMKFTRSCGLTSMLMGMIGGGFVFAFFQFAR